MLAYSNIVLLWILLIVLAGDFLKKYFSSHKMLLRIDPESKLKEQGITERQLAASFIHLQNFLGSAWSFLLG